MGNSYNDIADRAATVTNAAVTQAATAAGSRKALRLAEIALDDAASAHSRAYNLAPSARDRAHHHEMVEILRGRANEIRRAT